MGTTSKPFAANLRDRRLLAYGLWRPWLPSGARERAMVEAALHKELIMPVILWLLGVPLGLILLFMFVF